MNVNKSNIKKFIVNSFGTFGYGACVFQWLWALVLFLPAILADQKVHDFILPKSAEQSPKHIIAIDGSSVVLTLIAVITTIIVLAITTVVLVKLPVRFARASHRAVTRAADRLEPIVVKHKVLPEKKRQKVKNELVIAIKCSIVLVPFTSLLGLLFITVAIDSTIGFIVGALLAASSIFWFVIEYSAALILKVPLKDVV